MDKWLCWGSMGLAGLMMLAFILDLALPSGAKPFGGLSTAVDILAIISCALIIYLGWDSYRELR